MRTSVSQTFATISAADDVGREVRLERRGVGQRADDERPRPRRRRRGEQECEQAQRGRRAPWKIGDQWGSSSVSSRTVGVW